MLILGCLLCESRENLDEGGKKNKELGPKWHRNYPPATIYHQTCICYDISASYFEKWMTYWKYLLCLVVSPFIGQDVEIPWHLAMDCWSFMFSQVSSWLLPTIIVKRKEPEAWACHRIPLEYICTFGVQMGLFWTHFVWWHGPQGPIHNNPRNNNVIVTNTANL